MEEVEAEVTDIVPIKGDPNVEKVPRSLSVYQWFRSSFDGYRECKSLKRQRSKYV